VNDALHCIIRSDATILECVKRFAETHAGIVLFVDEDGKFAGLLTAGSIFRLLAQGVPLESPAGPQINKNPITVTSDFTDAEILRLMSRRGVTQIPVIAQDGSVARVVTQAWLLRETVLTNPAVIMAGGEGRRLRPLTEQLPKALVPVNGKPLIVRIIERLAHFGILDITISVRHKADEIRSAIGDGSRWHVNVSYVEEVVPLGTCGSLRLVPGPWIEACFVLNCDVMSDIDLVDMYRFHELHRSDLTVAVKDRHIEVPFGIVEVDHERVVRLSEKPKLKFNVNAGMYLMSPKARAIIPDGPYDMTDLITELLSRDLNVCSFPLRTAWLDVGDHDSLRQAEAGTLD
jgi:dTDP-glucose pyrophosphorylase